MNGEAWRANLYHPDITTDHNVLDGSIKATRENLQNQRHYISEDIKRERGELRVARSWAGVGVSNQKVALALALAEPPALALALALVVRPVRPRKLTITLPLFVCRLLSSASTLTRSSQTWREVLVERHRRRSGKRGPSITRPAT
jgi:hypothetical protein